MFFMMPRQEDMGDSIQDIQFIIGTNVLSTKFEGFYAFLTCLHQEITLTFIYC